MYCRKCYTKLDPAHWEANPPPSPADAAYNRLFARRCPKCGRTFDPANPKSTLARPFPDKMQILRHVVVTTLICVAVAYVVAMFQMVGASGH